ncbi:MAG: PQQ-dependent sugar dehydrogenase [Nocardioides sp.]
MRPSVPIALAALIGLAVPAFAVSPVLTGQVASPRAAAGPNLTVTTLADGLSHPWDMKSIGSGRVLITEREPARLTVAEGGNTRAVNFPSSRIWVSGETGLMGLEVDPDFTDNGRFYTCSGWNTDGGGHDVRVNAWKLNSGATRARLVKPLLTGLPTSTGRHGGCRLLLAENGALVVGTGDAAVGTNPQDRTSLGGKTLRLDRLTGRPWPSNPYARASNKNRRYVFTYGHRNVQGLAERSDGSLWSVEHGPDRDDEVNKLVAGGNYGWNPVPGYNESVPMTDQGLPGDQVNARWRSGTPTVATSGATFVTGKNWGAYRGALAVATLKAERLLLMKFDRSGRLNRVFTPAALRRYGRLRTVTQLPNGQVLVATDGADGTGQVLLVRPRS